MTNLENKLVTLDPRDESDHGPALLAPRPHTLDGKTLGLLSNKREIRNQGHRGIQQGQPPVARQLRGAERVRRQM
jgi:hypothetical protein